MQRLSASDLDAALRFVHDAAAETGHDPFPVHVVEGLRALLGCEWGTYCELDRPHHEVLAAVQSPVAEPELADEDDVFWRIVEDHPLCRAQRAGRFDAIKLSDFQTSREFHRTEVYADWFRPQGVEYELEAAIPSSREHTRTFLFDDARRDFSERERSLLNLLTPHLTQLHRAAGVRRLADAARAVLDDGRDAAPALLVIGVRGDVEVASPPARELLSRYGIGGRLPATITGWLDAARAGRADASLRIEGPPGTLLLDLDMRGEACVVLLSERASALADPAALSAREHEVLALVRDGLRNAEIAEVLWVSPATVRKHLENIYEKLDVHTRTAAVARIHGPA